MVELATKLLFYVAEILVGLFAFGVLGGFVALLIYYPLMLALPALTILILFGARAIGFIILDLISEKMASRKLGPLE